MTPPPNRARIILIALILSDDHSVKRSALVASIWPDSSPESRKVRMRQELANLRAFFDALGCPDCLSAGRDALQLDVSKLRVDYIVINDAVDSFEAAPQANAGVVFPMLIKLGNQVPAPDLAEFFNKPLCRFQTRIQSTRLLLAKHLLECGRQQDALRVIADILEFNPGYAPALSLQESALLATTQSLPSVSLKDSKTQSRTPLLTRNWASGCFIGVAAGIALFLWKGTLGVNNTSISMLNLATVLMYVDTPDSGELSDSEGTSAFVRGETVAVAGFTRTQSEDVDGLTLLLNASGKLIWRKRFHSASHDCDRFFQVAQDQNGNVYSAGESYLKRDSGLDEGWYGRVVSYSPDGSLRFVGRTGRSVANTNGVVRIIPATDGGCWLYTTTLQQKHYYIMVSHFSAKGKLLSEHLLDESSALLSDVRVASDGTQYVFGTAEIATGTSAHRDWFVAKLSQQGESCWSEHLDGPAPGSSDDERCTGILDVKNSVILYGVMEWARDGHGSTTSLSPSLARLDESTGNIIKLTQIPTKMSSPLVRCWDIYEHTQTLVVLVSLRDTNAQTVEWYLVHKVTGAIEQQGQFTIPATLTAIGAISGSVTSTGDVRIAVSARRNLAGTLPSALVYATCKPDRDTNLDVIEHSPVLKLTSQTNGLVVGQATNTNGRVALIVTKINAGNRTQ